MLVKAATGSPKNMRAEAADRDVEGAGVERVHLGVALHERDVGRRPRPPLAPRARSSICGRQVDAERRSLSAARRAASRGRLAGAAADVEHAVGRRDDQPGVDRSAAGGAGPRARSGRRARSSRSPSWPSHAAACSTFAISIAGLLADPYTPFGSNSMPPKGGCQWPGAPAHHHVVRHPRPARASSRGRPTSWPSRCSGRSGSSGPGPRASSTRSPRSSSAHGLATATAEHGRQAPPHRLHDHAQGPAGAGGVGADAGRRARSSSSRGWCKVFFAEHGTKDDLLATIDRRTTGWSDSATRTAWASRGLPRRRGSVPRAPAVAHPLRAVPDGVHRRSSAGRSGRRRSSRRGPTTCARPSPTGPRSRSMAEVTEARAEVTPTT